MGTVSGNAGAGSSLILDTVIDAVSNFCKERSQSISSIASSILDLDFSSHWTQFVNIVSFERVEFHPSELKAKEVQTILFGLGLATVITGITISIFGCYCGSKKVSKNSLDTKKTKQDPVSSVSKEETKEKPEAKARVESDASSIASDPAGAAEAEEDHLRIELGAGRFDAEGAGFGAAAFVDSYRFTLEEYTNGLAAFEKEETEIRKAHKEIDEAMKVNGYTLLERGHLESCIAPNNAVNYFKARIGQIIIERNRIKEALDDAETKAAEANQENQAEIAQLTGELEAARRESDEAKAEAGRVNSENETKIAQLTGELEAARRVSEEAGTEAAQANERNKAEIARLTDDLRTARATFDAEKINDIEVKEKFQQKITELEQKLTSAKKEHEEQLSAEKALQARQHQQELQRFRAVHSDAKRKYEEALAAQIEKLNEKHQKEIQQIENKLATVQQKHTESLADKETELAEEHKQQIEKLREEITALKSEHKAKLIDQETAIRANFHDERVSLGKELSLANKQSQERLVALTQAERQITQLRQEHQEERSELNRQIRLGLSSLQERLKAEHPNLEEGIEQFCDVLCIRFKDVRTEFSRKYDERRCKGLEKSLSKEDQKIEKIKGLLAGAELNQSGMAKINAQITECFETQEKLAKEVDSAKEKFIKIKKDFQSLREISSIGLSRELIARIESQIRDIDAFLENSILQKLANFEQKLLMLNKEAGIANAKLLGVYIPTPEAPKRDEGGAAAIDAPSLESTHGAPSAPLQDVTELVEGMQRAIQQPGTPERQKLSSHVDQLKQAGTPEEAARQVQNMQEIVGKMTKKEQKQGGIPVLGTLFQRFSGKSAVDMKPQDLFPDTVAAGGGGAAAKRSKSRKDN